MIGMHLFQLVDLQLKSLTKTVSQYLKVLGRQLLKKHSTEKIIETTLKMVAFFSVAPLTLEHESAPYKSARLIMQVI